MAANPYDLTTREVLSILFKERRKLIGVFLGLTLLVIGFSYTMTPYYEASSRLLVKSGREFQVRSDPNQPVVSVPSNTKQEVVNSEIQILTSRDLVVAVIKQVGADRLYPGSGGWFGSDAGAMDVALRKFYADFKVSPVELADVIEVTYRNPNHDVAVQALNALIELYQRKHAEMFSDPRYKFLEQQTRQYETQLDAATRKVTDIKNSKSLFDIDAQRAKLIDDRAATNTILQQLQSQAVDAHKRIDFLTARLRTTPTLVVGGDTEADVVEQTKARMLDLQVKAQQLRERYVGDVKPLQDTEQEIARLKQLLNGAGSANRKSSSQRNPAYDDMAVALNRALADAAPLDQQIVLRKQQETAAENRLRSLEDGAKALDDAQRERRTLEELVHTYRTQYEAARMSENLDRDNVISVSVLQSPAAAEQPAGPRHLPFALAGILIGLVGASGVLIYLLVFRETLITVESVERIIGVPVLASVPNSRRPDNDNRRRAA
ncbi:MAG TPA: Wzz/FepE/Etk N-terminal domain-containing protein [Stellaceae bacterium]|jgi:uncharacterized protein involved in exopolysaccharide biosynthesis|nr:Wzz/FepE/Etk N-terminal domain-containing protein [Stellaceae bacterium]